MITMRWAGKAEPTPGRHAPRSPLPAQDGGHQLVAEVHVGLRHSDDVQLVAVDL
jgi:hypothetical protein